MTREMARRLAIYDAGDANPTTQRILLELARKDLGFFTDQFVWTFDPRLMIDMPMVLFPKQREYLAFVEQCLDTPTDFLCEKSRDMGVTYLNVVIAVHRWLFFPGFITGFCANLVELVDQLGNPKSILEKVRMVLKHLPRWMQPEGFRFGVHDMFCRIINPATGAVIIGEGGDNAGRGGRTSLYLIDEAAHLSRPDRVNAATSATSRCRGWVSSVNGMGNLFARLRHEGHTPVITLHWRDDPRKDEAWAAKEKLRLGATVFAAEHDIDYGASVEGLLIVKPWIDAAVELGQRLQAQGWKPRGPVIAGLDVGVGRDLSVLILRQGPLVSMPESWADPNTIKTALHALEVCRAAGARQLVFDPLGVGAGVADTLAAENAGRDGLDDPWLAITPFNAGNPATDTVQHDGRTAREWFRNLRAEGWWRVRERLKRSFELLLHLDGKDGGVAHEPEDCLLLCNSVPLRHELNLPRWFLASMGGSTKIQVEGKDHLKQRGIKSPDFADALVMCCHEGGLETWAADAVIPVDPRPAPEWQGPAPWQQEGRPAPWAE